MLPNRPDLSMIDDAARRATPQEPGPMYEGMPKTHPELEYAGFGVRFVAFVIDSALALLVLGPLLLGSLGPLLDTLAALGVASPGWLVRAVGFMPPLSGPAQFLLNYVVPAVAVVLFWLVRRATPGKMVLAAQVVDARTGGTLTTGQAIGRYLAYYLSILPLGLGLLWVAFDARKQGWHDKLAGTVVVRPRPAGSPAPPVTFG